jgi:hypothetical protein
MSRVATVVETRVPPGLLPDFVRAYSLGVTQLPPELNQTFLIRSESDPTVVRIHQYWLKVASMEQVASPLYLRACMELLGGAGVLPVTSSFVVLDQGHPLIGQPGSSR